MKLSDLKKGQKAKVIQILPGTSSQRIMELGLVAGTIVSYKSAAPLGDPIAFEMGSSTLSMRIKEASIIQVELIP